MTGQNTQVADFRYHAVSKQGLDVEGVSKLARSDRGSIPVVIRNVGAVGKEEERLVAPVW
jgi:hypothetical protein